MTELSTGTLASDGRPSEKHSPFAKHQLRELQVQGISMDKLFDWVKDGVIQEGLQRGETNVQHPEIRNNLYPSRLTKLQLNSEQDFVQCPAHFLLTLELVSVQAVCAKWCLSQSSVVKPCTKTPNQLPM